MKLEEFNNVIETELERVRKVIVSKGEEYARGDDRLHNFQKGADFRKKCKEEILWGMVMKHFTALDDFIQDLEKGIVAPRAQWDEKLGDIVVYSLILKAIVSERFETQALEKRLEMLKVQIPFSTVERDSNYRPEHWQSDPKGPSEAP